MKKYALLCNPGHNKVYFETSLALAVSEISVVATNMTEKPSDIQNEIISAINYITFTTENKLSESDLHTVSALSFVFAIFEIVEVNDKTCFVPTEKSAKPFVHDSISSMLKYSGKTNELFTRMMINIAYNLQPNKGKIKMLDPVAGKGTTLYEGLIKGFDSYGIEVGDKVVNEAYHFVKKFCENNKYKHKTDKIRVSGPNKSYTATKYDVDIAVTKEDFKDKKFTKFEMISGNSINANDFYKKNFFDIIVGDLPYGVQHGNVTNEKQSSLTRNPTQLLRACLPVWKEVLKTGGVVVISWNSNVMSREKVADIFNEKGFTVFDEDVFLSFEHRVDQAVMRDIIVAKKA